jgi:hypothetical protein
MLSDRPPPSTHCLSRFTSVQIQAANGYFAEPELEPFVRIVGARTKTWSRSGN